MSAATADPYAIDVAACRRRQERLLKFMRQHEIDLAIVTQNQHVQYLTGARFAWTFSPVAALTAAGHMTIL